jgi:hypothetical protein
MPPKNVIYGRLNNREKAVESAYLGHEMRMWKRICNKRFLKINLNSCLGILDIFLKRERMLNKGCRCLCPTSSCVSLTYMKCLLIVLCI